MFGRAGILLKLTALSSAAKLPPRAAGANLILTAPVPWRRANLMQTARADNEHCKFADAPAKNTKQK